MITDTIYLEQTEEEGNRLIEIYKELSSLFRDIDNLKEVDWKAEERLQEERYMIEGAIIKRYLDSTTPEKALDDAKKLLGALTREDYESDVQLYKRYATIENPDEEARKRAELRATNTPEGCMDFLSSYLRYQQAAMLDGGGEYETELKELRKAITAKIKEWFPGWHPEGESVSSLVPWKPDAPFTVPNSDQLYFLTRMINQSKRKQKPTGSSLNRHEIIEVEKDTNKEGEVTAIRFIRTVTAAEKDKSTGRRVEKPQYKMTTEINVLTISQNKGFLKIFKFIIMILATKDFPPEIEIPYQWLVDLPIKMYSTTGNAKRAIGLFRKQILDVKMITDYADEKGNIDPGPANVLFYGCEPLNKTFKLYVNTKFDWNSIGRFFTTNPPFIFQLPENAFNLADYIFYLARQRTDKIKDDGTLVFTISAKTIAEHLGLPPVDKVKNREYWKFIKKPIEDAIEAIEEKTKDDPTCKDLAFALEPHFPDTKDINEWLSAGQLEVILKGDYTTKFQEIEQKKAYLQKLTEKAKSQEAGKIAARKEAAAQKKKSEE